MLKILENKPLASDLISAGKSIIIDRIGESNKVGGVKSKATYSSEKNQKQLSPKFG